MIVHLIPDDKFLDDAYRVFEQVAARQNAYFLLTPDKQPLNYIKTFEPEQIDCSEMAKFLKKNNERIKIIIIHFMTNEVRSILESVSPKAPVIWLGWGADYYHLIAPFQDFLLPKTKQLLEIKPQRDNKISSSPWRRQILKLFTSKPSESYSKIRQRFNNRQNQKVPPIGKEWLTKVSYFAPVVDLDYQLVTNRQRWFRPQYLSWNYPVMGSVFNKIDEASAARGANILMGNSATSTNNHLDVLADLRPLLSNENQIICPLSYGDQAYGDLIEKAGKQMYGDRFVALRDFLSLDEYFTILMTCSTTVMGHLRQQAFGNILMMLYSGSEIILHPRSTLYRWFSKEGIRVTQLGGNTEARAKKNALHHSVELARTRQWLTSRFGEAAEIERTKLLVNRDIKRC